MLEQQDRERIGLFAGRAARHPDPYRVAAALALEQRRDDLPGQRVERLGVAEERGDADQQVVEQG